MKKASSSRLVSVYPCLLLLLFLSIPVQGQPASQVTAWGDNFYGQLNVPPDLTNAVAIASGFAHNLALRSDGTVSAWGYNAFGQTNVPAGLTTVSAVTAGRYHSLALKQNGTLVPWGSSASGLLNVPTGLTNAVAIRAGSAHNLVIKSDGSVAGWGDNSSGQLNIPAGLSNVVAVAGGLAHSMALRDNGTVAAWGDDTHQQTDVPAGLSNVVAIASGDHHNLALRANGTVVAWGYDNYHQIDVPPGLSNVAAIACGYYASLATKSNGTVVGWGQFQPPAGLTNVAALSAGNLHGLALGGSLPAIIAQPTNLTVVEFSNATFTVGVIGLPAVTYQWRFNGTNLAGATASSFTLAPAHLTDAGSYSVYLANIFGSVTSAPAVLTVLPSVVARCADSTVSAGANCMANASIDAGSFDRGGGTVTLTQSPPGPYPLGTNVVTLNVSNDRGGSASCSARVIVLDRTPPQLTPPANIIAVNDADQCGAVVTFAQPTANDCSAVTQITCIPPSGSFFPVGTTTVQCAATDAAGNTANTNFTVTVFDHQAPSLVCPADMVVTNAPNAASSIVTYSPTATDNCPGLGPVVCDPPSGSSLAPGVHTIQCSVTDAAGNTSACSFRVTVWPGLVVRCADVTVSANSNCVANASIDGGSTNLSGGTITLSQTPPGPYPLGTNDVTLTVSDGHGASGSCTARVIVLDRTPPQLTPPANIIAVNDADQCGAVVTFALAVANDCSAITQNTCSPPSGSLFPVGTTTVQCTATDAAGNTANTNFTVTVYDQQAPTLICPSDMVVTNAPGAATSIVTYNPTATDNCPGLGPVVCDPPSGSAFAPGVHTVHCSVTDAAGNTSACSFHVTVWAGVVVRCADVTVSANSNCVANASIDAGSTNLSGGAITLTQTPPGPYPLGTNTVTLTASDDRGGSASCSARVIVVDRTPPQLTPPANIIAANDADQCGGIVTFAQPVASDTCSAVTQISCVPPSGSLFPVGTTTVQCIATDAAGNTAVASFTVTVYDQQPPTIICPADIVVTNAPGSSTTVVTYSPTATDNCPGLGAVICTPPSGTAFTPGVHTVQCSVTDAAGNTSTCSFHVTVWLSSGNQPPVPVIQLSPLITLPGITNLTVLAPDGTNADIICDGSKSYDPNHGTFLAAWFVGSSRFSTDLVAGVTLPLGFHTITLALDDTLPNGQSSSSVQVEVLSPEQAIEVIENIVENSGLPAQKQKPLLATLDAAMASAAANHLNATLGQLGAFENKVQAQLSRSDPALAKVLVSAAQEIVKALQP
jgi:hypothetical protein